MSVCKECGKQIADNEKYCANHKFKKNYKRKKIVEGVVALGGFVIVVAKAGGKGLLKILKR